MTNPTSPDELSAFVREVYRAVLHRDPSAAETEQVVGTLAAGASSPLEFAASVISSDEARRLREASVTPQLESDMTDDGPFGEFLTRVRPYSMTTSANLFATFDAVRHVVRNGIDGALVECGVWRGGNSMMMALTLSHLGETRPLWLYDTFSGMTAPTPDDIRHDGEAASNIWAPADDGDGSTWWPVPEDEVRHNLLSTGHAVDELHLVKGPVERTLDEVVPERIAILRLDTDWYESTLKEMQVLYPRLVSGGILIIDDYAWWRGARQAVEEYFAAHGPRPHLARIDPAGARLGVKP